MKTYTFSEARANLARVLDEATREQVVIRRRKGDSFTIVPHRAPAKSPFDVPGLETDISRDEIVDAIRESRKG